MCGPLNTFHHFRTILVIRILTNWAGRKQSVTTPLHISPKIRKPTYFLTQFCELYYRRNRYTVNDDFTKAFYFLDGKLGNDIMAAYKNDKAIENFLANPSSPEALISMRNRWRWSPC